MNTFSAPGRPGARKARSPIASYRGATTEPMKPRCTEHRLVASLSHIGDVGNPARFSRSPWWKNSSMIRSAHARDGLAARTGLLMSAAWSTIAATKSILSSSLLGFAVAEAAVIDAEHSRMRSTMGKCLHMSV